MTRHPPSPVVRVFVPWNEKTPKCPREPACSDPHRDPMASAASSMRINPNSSARALSAGISARLPYKCVAIMALVFAVIAALTSVGSMHQVSGRMSTKTGVAPRWTIGATVATQFMSARMTSSFRPIPIAAKPNSRAPVQLDVATAYLVPT